MVFWPLVGEPELDDGEREEEEEVDGRGVGGDRPAGGRSSKADAFLTLCFFSLLIEIEKVLLEAGFCRLASCTSKGVLEKEDDGR